MKAKEMSSIVEYKKKMVQRSSDTKTRLCRLLSTLGVADDDFAGGEASSDLEKTVRLAMHLSLYDGACLGKLDRL